MTGCLDNIETFSRLNKALVDLLLTPAKDPATSAKNVRRQARAWDRITQGESAQHSADYVALALDLIYKNSVAEIDKGVLACLVGTCCPAFDSHTNITHEKVFEIDATTPSVISLDIAVIYPISSRENVRAPKRNVEFPVRVPLRARRWSNLLHLLARIANPCKSSRSDQSGPQEAQQQLFHHFSFWLKSLQTFHI